MISLRLLHVQPFKMTKHCVIHDMDYKLYFQARNNQLTVSFHSTELSLFWPPMRAQRHLYPFSLKSSPLSRYHVLPSSFVPNSLTSSSSRFIPHSFSLAIPVSLFKNIELVLFQNDVIFYNIEDKFLPHQRTYILCLINIAFWFLIL